MGSIDPPSTWKQLDVAVIGGGVGGLAAATSLRKAGHKVTIYERAHFAGEVGASISCAANGTRWLEEWGVNISIGRPVVLQKLILHDWQTGEINNVYDLGDYKERWGYVYNMFHRVNMHAMLMDSAVSEEFPGVPAVLKVDHKCSGIDHETGIVTFENGVTARHDLIIGSDGIGSSVRRILGIEVDKKQSTSTCYHCIIDTTEVHRLGLKDLAPNAAIEFWGGVDNMEACGADSRNKIVYSPCREGEINSFYCFFPEALAKKGAGEKWTDSRLSVEDILAPFPNLDPELLAIFRNSTDIKPWRLFVHQPYSHWQKGRTCIMGDAAHPMMPDQSQGACQAIEDAAALGIIFGKEYDFASDARGITQGLAIYEQVRKPRASRVQAASARARENITERIGFSSNTKNPLYKVKDESQKLTIEEMNQYDPVIDIRNKATGANEEVYKLRSMAMPVTDAV
ncbi:hypothetical protein BLS_001881 [Venturia inaequalis]|uniref:FAD-binding domain-containing protein n=1 Tax=Venturia inaequalis TaxID=5025 RepID=A0A8H3YWX0_VENIN|nr:hypothetical protein EG327_010643 [Venturia inaequalis]KAE9976749.1 hypothetical protein BLS_001881 [Venturia inaequalis]KAE9986705.1 hypothetical protein EG328_005032 [Venturia inaequalis]